MEDTIESTKSSIYERFLIRITSITSYFFPLITTLPNTAWWAGIMIFPFYVYIVAFFSNPFEYPIWIPNITNPVILVSTIIVIVTLLYLSWSIVYLHRRGRNLLVTTGPYQFVRHPQYFSLIIITGIMTLHSVWTHQYFHSATFQATYIQIVWILTLTCYAVFSKLEERYLKTQFSEELTVYRNEVGYIIPGIKSNSNIIEILSGIVIPYATLFVILMILNYSGIHPLW